MPQPRTKVGTGFAHKGARQKRGLRDMHPMQSSVPQPRPRPRSEEHTSELQSLMRISYAVFCLKKKNKTNNTPNIHTQPPSNTNTQTKHNTRRIHIKQPT